MLTLDKVYHAAFKLKEVIRPTDLIHAPQINPDADVYLKTENLQVTGSFKVRGAYYKISTLRLFLRRFGVSFHSFRGRAVAQALFTQGAVFVDVPGFTFHGAGADSVSCGSSSSRASKSASSTWFRK